MQIHRALFLTLLEESAAFRNHIANLLLDDAFHQRVIDLVVTANGKIDAIKKVRVLAQENVTLMKSHFPQLEWFTSNYSEFPYQREAIGLACAKRFVESIKSNWD